MNSYLSKLFIQYLRSPFTYVSFVLPFFLLIGLGWMVPSSFILNFVTSVGIISIVMFLFGGTMLEIRKTSFVKSLSLTKITKTKVILSNIIISFAFSFGLFLFMILMVWVLSTQISFLATDWSYWGEQEYLTWIKGSIDWNSINWFHLMGVFILTITITYVLIFFVISIIKNFLTLYLFSVFYILSFIFLTWIIVPSILPYSRYVENNSFAFLLNLKYLIPNYWTNVFMNSALPTIKDYSELFNYLGISNDELAMEVIGQIMDSISNLEFNWTAFESDVNLFTNFLNSWQDGVVIGHYNDEIPNFTSQFFQNNIDILSKPFLHELSLNINNNLFIPISGNLVTQQWIEFIFNKVELWDFNNYKSIFLSVSPFIFIVIFGAWGIKNFEWSIR